MTSPRLPLAVALLMLIPALRAADPAPPAGAPPAFPLEAYAAVGSNFAQNTRIADLGWTEEQFNAFVDGLRAQFRGQPKPFDTQARLLHESIARRLQALAQQEESRRQQKFTGPEGLEAYMKEAVKGFKLQRADSGLAYGLMGKGNGSRPGPDDTVVVTYNAVASDAKTELPSISVSKLRVKVSDLLPGLAEAAQMMTADSSALLVVPPDLTYGEGTWPAGVAKGSPIIFSFNLHEIIVAH